MATSNGLVAGNGEKSRGEGSPWGNFEKLGENFCEQSEQSWGNFLRAKRAVVGKFLRAKRSLVGEIIAGEISSFGPRSKALFQGKRVFLRL